jgi:hypothetical protein
MNLTCKHFCQFFCLSQGQLTANLPVLCVFPWLVRFVLRAGTKDFCPALAALVGPVQHIFLKVHYLNSFVPIAQ